MGSLAAKTDRQLAIAISAPACWRYRDVAAQTIGLGSIGPLKVFALSVVTITTAQGCCKCLRHSSKCRLPITFVAQVPRGSW